MEDGRTMNDTEVGAKSPTQSMCSVCEQHTLATLLAQLNNEYR